MVHVKRSQKYLFEFLRKKKEESRGDHFWQGLQKFRKVIQSEGIIFTENDFANLPDRSVRRELLPLRPVFSHIFAEIG